MCKLSDKNDNDLLKTYNYFEKNKVNIETILLMMNMYFRDMLIYSRTKNEKILINSDKKDIIFKCVEKFSTYSFQNCLAIINSARESLIRNVNFQLAMEVMLLKLQEELK